MARSNHFMVLLILFMFSVLLSSMVAEPSKLMQDICRATANYGDRVSALNMDPGSASADLIGLAKIALLQGQFNTSDPSLITPLQACLISYEAAVQSFAGAHGMVEEDPKSSNKDVKIAGDNADQCAEELTRAKANIPAVTTRNRYVKLYSNIGDVITGRLA